MIHETEAAILKFAMRVDVLRLVLISMFDFETNNIGKSKCSYWYYTHTINVLLLLLLNQTQFITNTCREYNYWLLKSKISLFSCLHRFPIKDFNQYPHTNMIYFSAVC